MQEFAVNAKSGTRRGILAVASSAFYKFTRRFGNEPKLERTGLLPGGQTLAIMPDMISRFSGKGASFTRSHAEHIGNVSGTPNLVVPNRVLGAVFTT